MQEDAIPKRLITEVFEKAKTDSGNEARSSLAKYVHHRLLEILEGAGSENMPISVRTLERYYQKHIENVEVDSYCEPDDRVRYQLVKFLGYNNYNEYLYNHYQNLDQSSKITVTNNHAQRDIYNIDKLEGGLTIS